MTDSLTHFGIKGMRWGVRRERDDSPVSVSVTAKPSGKLRLKGGQNSGASADAIRARSSQQKVKKSSLNALSDDELKQLVNRMNFEQQYAQLTTKEHKASPAYKAMQMGKNFAKSEMGKKIISTQSGRAVAFAMKKFLTPEQSMKIVDMMKKLKGES